MLKLGPNCDAKTKGIPTKQRSDAVKQCVKLAAFVAIVILVLQYGAQQLQASSIPAESLTNQQHKQQPCCIEHDSNVSNGTLFINSIDRHDRGVNDGPLVTNGHTLITSKNEQGKEPPQQVVRSDEAANKVENPLGESAGSGSENDANSDLATMASNGVVLLPKMIQNHITLDQLATLHENLDNSVEQPIIQHPSSQLDQLAGRLAGDINNLLAGTLDGPIKRQDDGAASVNQPSLADPVVAGSNARVTAQDLITAQAINNYGQEDPSGADNDDDDSTPDFNEPADVGQNQDKADSDEDDSGINGNSNAVAQQHQLNSVMQPMNGATNVYEGNTPRHVDAGSSLSREQTNDLADKVAANNNDEGPVMSAEQMPDSIESLMRSGGETGPLDTDGSTDDPSAADEPNGDPSQQLAAGGNNYAQNVEIPGVTPQDILLAGNAAGYPVASSLPGAASIQGAVGSDDDYDHDNDDDDGDGRSNGITSSLTPATLPVTYPDSRLPIQSAEGGPQLTTDSSYNGPTQDYLQTAAGHHYKKKKKKYKVVKYKKKIKKKKKKKYKVVVYKKKKKKKKKKGKKPMDHGKYYM